MSTSSYASRDRRGPLRFAIVATCFAATATIPTRVATAQQLVPMGAQPEAERHFASGRTHFNAGRYADALTEFRAALALVPSPNTRLYVGLSLRRAAARNAVEAFRELRRAEHEATARASAEPRFARTAEIARSEADALVSEIALATVLLSAELPGAVVRINGQPITPEQWNTEIALAPGPLEVDATADGYTPFHTTTTMRPGTHTRVRIALQPVATLAPVAGGPVAAPQQPAVTPSGTSNGHWRVDLREGPTPRPRRAPRGGSPLVPGGILTMSAGALLFVGGLAAGVYAVGLHNELGRECGTTRPCTAPNVESRAATGSTMVVLANIGYLGGAAVIALGGVLIFAGRVQDVIAADEDALPQQARAAPYLDPIGGTAGVHGRF